jgi:hypothetical protein
LKVEEKRSKKMEEIKRAVAVIGQLLGAILGKDTSTPSLETMYDYPNGRYFS